ncbi:MAG: hypothetical protein GXO48_09370 [Chlorobi bacterium]|nr:hypothetical protein [Chlorobiota bacterium]
MFIRFIILAATLTIATPTFGQSDGHIRHHADTIFCDMNPYADSLDTIIYIDSLGFLFGPNKDSISGIAYMQQAGIPTPDSCSIFYDYFISYIIVKILPYHVSESDSLWAELYVDSLSTTPNYISPFKTPLIPSDTPMWYLLWLPTPAFTTPTTVWIAVRWTTQSDSAFSIISHPAPINPPPLHFLQNNSWIPLSQITHSDSISFQPLIFTVASEVTNIPIPPKDTPCPFPKAFTLSGKQVTPQITTNAPTMYFNGPTVIILPNSRKILSPTGYIRCH